jgi:hypothetical protein
MTALHNDWPGRRAPSSRVADCFERIADDVRTFAAFVAPALASLKQARDALGGAPRRRARLKIGVRWSRDRVGSRQTCHRAEGRIVATPRHLSSRRGRDHGVPADNNEISVAIRRRDAELRAVIAEHREGS